jgi:hypothetical protein
MCVPPELRRDFKNHPSALCATPKACSIQITLLVLNQLTNRCATVVSAAEAIQNRFLPLLVLRFGQGKNNTIVVSSPKSSCAVYSTVDNDDAGLGKRPVAAAACAKALE